MLGIYLRIKTDHSCWGPLCGELTRKILSITFNLFIIIAVAEGRQLTITLTCDALCFSVLLAGTIMDKTKTFILDLKSPLGAANYGCCKNFSVC